MSGLGPAVICVAFILNEMTTEKDTNDLLYTEPDNPNFEKKKLKKERPTSGCFSSIRRFFFHEMKRFHQIPHKLALFMYLLILKVQCFSDGTTSG